MKTKRMVLVVALLVALLGMAVTSIAWQPVGYVIGQVKLQARSYGASLVNACGRSVWTDSQGRFRVACAPGQHRIEAFHTSYLSSAVEVQVESGAEVDLGVTTLIGGDVGSAGTATNQPWMQDNRIDSTDWLIVLTFLGQPVWRWPGADVNGDWKIDSTDLLLTLNQNLQPGLIWYGPTDWQ